MELLNSHNPFNRIIHELNIFEWIHKSIRSNKMKIMYINASVRGIPGKQNDISCLVILVEFQRTVGERMKRTKWK